MTPHLKIKMCCKVKPVAACTQLQQEPLASCKHATTRPHCLTCLALVRAAFRAAFPALAVLAALAAVCTPAEEGSGQVWSDHTVSV